MYRNCVIECGCQRKKMKSTRFKFIIVVLIYLLSFFVYYYLIYWGKISTQEIGLSELLEKIPFVSFASGLVSLYITYIYQIRSHNMQEDTLKMNGKANINFTKKQEIIRDNDLDGLIRFKMRIYNSNDNMLKKAKIHKVTISYNEKDIYGSYYDESIIFKNIHNKIIDLEYTPADSNKYEKNRDFYYAEVLLNCEKEKLLNRYFKLDIQMSVSTMFDVVTKSTYHLMFLPNKSITENWFEIEHNYVNFEKIEYNKNFL